jgi:TrmH family RNA methyltransferase
LVTERTFSSLGPHTPYTRVMALAIRPAIDIAAVLGHPGPEPVVLLQDPRDLGNLGAAVRVAAAASCAGVVTTGLHDPWSPPALRGSCGLHYAVPVGQAESLPACSRPLVAIDPSGSPFDPAALPERSVVTFGTERYGLTAELLQRADYTFKVPMQEGVSSLNLATCVAAVLFAWRLFHSTS